MTWPEAFDSVGRLAVFSSLVWAAAWSYVNTHRRR